MSVAIDERTRQHQEHMERRARLWAAPRPALAVVRPGPKPTPVIAYDEPIGPVYVEQRGILVYDAPINIRRLSYIAMARNLVAVHAAAYGVSEMDIASERRNAEVVRARQHLMHDLRHMTPWSLPRIGRFLGGRDHTTVLHGVRMHERRGKNGNAKAAYRPTKLWPEDRLKKLIALVEAGASSTDVALAMHRSRDTCKRQMGLARSAGLTNADIGRTMPKKFWSNAETAELIRCVTAGLTKRQTAASIKTRTISACAKRLSDLRRVGLTDLYFKQGGVDHG